MNKHNLIYAVIAGFIGLALCSSIHAIDQESVVVVYAGDSIGAAGLTKVEDLDATGNVTAGSGSANTFTVNSTSTFNAASTFQQTISVQGANPSVVKNQLDICTGCTNPTEFGPGVAEVNNGSTTGAVLIGTANTGGITLGQATNPTSVAGQLTLKGHLLASTTAPTLSACGTSTLEVGSTDVLWTIDWDATSTSCVITFSGVAYTHHPDCTLTFTDLNNKGNVPQWVHSWTTNSITIDQTSASSGAVTGVCGGQ